jgi:L-methionine (R)-S-oxide reductase
LAENSANSANSARRVSQMSSDTQVVDQVERLVASEAPRGLVLSQAVRILKDERPHYDWVGIYLLDDDMLILDNYLGKPTEHSRIRVGTGVCGAAVAQKENQVIGDVTSLDNYLACSLETRSEIVVLIRRGEQIFGQIDIDSDKVNAFNSEDELLLSRVADLLARRF